MRSGSNLVIRTHQQGIFKTFIRYRSDFPMPLRSSALPESPNLSQNDISGHLVTSFLAKNSISISYKAVLFIGTIGQNARGPVHKEKKWISLFLILFIQEYCSSFLMPFSQKIVYT
jgi:hypothetical protein